MRFKSITAQITLFFGMLTFIICAGLGICAYFSSSNALKTSIDQSLLEIAKADAKIISEKVNSQLNALESLANSWWLRSEELTIEQKIEFLIVSLNGVYG